MKEEVYTLMLTDNKRQIIFDSNNNFVDTKPIFIKDKTPVKKKGL